MELLIKATMNKNLTIDINAGTVIKILAILGITALLWQLRELVLIIVTSIVLASATEPGIRFFTKLKLPRVFSVLIVYVAVIGMDGAGKSTLVQNLNNHYSKTLTSKAFFLGMHRSKSVLPKKLRYL